MGRWKALQNLSIIIVSTILIFLCIELVTRVFYEIPSSEISAFDLKKSHYYQKDSELWWVPGKNIHGEHTKQGSFSSTFRTNSRGLRDREYTLDKPADVKRIVVVGDSFTWGFGVNDDEIYTEKLEALLRNTEVINLGVTAYQLKQEILYFKREGMLYDPDILIVGLCLNDFMHGKVNRRTEKQIKTATENRSEKTEVEQSSTGSTFKHYMKKYLFKHSALLTMISHRVSTNKSLVKLLSYFGLKELTGFEGLDTNLMPALKEYPDYLHTSWEKTKSELMQLKNITSESGVRLIIAVIPSVQSVQEISFRHSISHSVFEKEDFDLDKPYRMLQDFTLANNIEIIIPVNSFREEQKNNRQLYLTRDMHFNAAGHDLFAREIADYLIENSI